MKKSVLILGAVLLVGTTAGAGEPDLAVLIDWMTGSFSSAAQAEADSAYYDIRLEMAPIWTDRDDAAWLYAEQAVAGMTDRPYRQRVYKVTATEDATSAVIVTSGRIESWARGFDDEGVQVWGAEKGACVFLRDAGKAE